MINYSTLLTDYLKEMDFGSRFDSWYKDQCLNVKKDYFINKIKDLDVDYYNKKIKDKEQMMTFSTFIAMASRVNYRVEHPDETSFDKDEMDSKISELRHVLNYKNKKQKRENPTIVECLNLAKIGYKDDCSPEECFKIINKMLQYVKYDDMEQGNFYLHVREIEHMLLWNCAYFGLGKDGYNQLLDFYVNIRTLYDYAQASSDDENVLFDKDWVCPDHIEKIRQNFLYKMLSPKMQNQVALNLDNMIDKGGFFESEIDLNPTGSIIQDLQIIMEKCKELNYSSKQVIPCLKWFIINKAYAFGAEQNFLKRLLKGYDETQDGEHFIGSFLSWKENLIRKAKKVLKDPNKFNNGFKNMFNKNVFLNSTKDDIFYLVKNYVEKSYKLLYMSEEEKESYLSVWENSLNKINDLFQLDCEIKSNKEKRIKKLSKWINSIIKDVDNYSQESVVNRFFNTIFFGYSNMSKKQKNIYEDYKNADPEYFEIYDEDEKGPIRKSCFHVPRNAILLWILDNYYDELQNKGKYTVNGFCELLKELQGDNEMIYFEPEEKYENPFEKFIIKTCIESGSKPDDFICKMISEGIKKEIEKESETTISYGRY